MASPASAAATIRGYDGWNLFFEYAGQDPAMTYLRGMDSSGTMQGAGGVGELSAVCLHDPRYPIAYPAFDGNGTEYLDAMGDVAVHLEFDPNRQVRYP